MERLASTLRMGNKHYLLMTRISTVKDIGYRRSTAVLIAWRCIYDVCGFHKFHDIIIWAKDRSGRFELHLTTQTSFRHMSYTYTNDTTFVAEGCTQILLWNNNGIFLSDPHVISSVKLCLKFLYLHFSKTFYKSWIRSHIYVIMTTGNRVFYKILIFWLPSMWS